MVLELLFEYGEHESSSVAQILNVVPYIYVIRVKNENCEFPRKLCTDFLVALSVETPWMFTLLPPKQRKFTS